MNEARPDHTQAADIRQPAPAEGPPRRRDWWPLVAALAATIPFAGIFTLQRIFHLRDLSLFFWERHLWFRRAIWSGDWPLWDPYVGGGQSAVADGLHQMFFLPALAVRLAGTEVLSFNLWVALPFPLAALGAYAFFRSRFSGQAAALGAIVFAVSGPVVSSGNFPNLSWSVAAMPWVLWAADRLARTGSARSVAMLAAAIACQVFAGEPVSMAATAVTAIVLSLVAGRPSPAEGTQQAARWRLLPVRAACVSGALLLGAAIAAVQILPMSAAVQDSWRPYSRMTDFWAFHPLALVETVWLHAFGNRLDTTLLREVPWMGPLNSGRDPFFYSLYLGPAVLALAAMGAVVGRDRRWSRFWIVVAAVALVASFGAFTPFYPFLQAHLPLVKSFRYPVKYLVVAVMAVAALAASAWETLATLQPAERDGRRGVVGMLAAAAVPALLALAAAGLTVATTWWSHATARAFYDLAVRIGSSDPVGCAAFALETVPAGASRLALVSLVACVLLLAAWKQAPRNGILRVVLFVLLATDLVVSAWGINPMFDAALAREPSWAPIVAAHPDTRFYLGGRGLYGTINDDDPDAARTFARPFGMTPEEGRSALSIQSVFYPSPWRARELLSYDLPVLGPRPLMLAHSRFLQATAEERDRFLQRTAVRWRIVSPTAAPGRTPLARLDYFRTMCLYDWGPGLTRAYVVPEQLVVPDINAQIEAMFGPRLDVRRVVLTTTPAGPPAGRPSTAASSSARILDESSNRVLVEASVPAPGGFLVLLDTFTPDWEATVDGQPAAIFRANALFRTVALVAGTHRVEFRYRPWSFQVGAAITLAGLLVLVLLLRQPSRRRTPQS
jgi:hypothetical protein